MMGGPTVRHYSAALFLVRKPRMWWCVGGPRGWRKTNLGSEGPLIVHDSTPAWGARGARAALGVRAAAVVVSMIVVLHRQQIMIVVVEEQYLLT